MNVSNSKSFEFKTGSMESPLIYIEKSEPLIFYTKESIELIANVQHLKCTEGSVVEIRDSELE